MSVDTLLDRLDGVRSTGPGKWIARCPAHDDKRPSLSVREGDSGATLAYCWAGCAIADIAAAAGLNLSEFFPPRRDDLYDNAGMLDRRKRRCGALTPLVATFERDVIIVQLLLLDIAQGKPIDDADRATAKAAAERVYGALQEARRVI